MFVLRFIYNIISSLKLAAPLEAPSFSVFFAFLEGGLHLDRSQPVFEIFKSLGAEIAQTYGVAAEKGYVGFSANST